MRLAYCIVGITTACWLRQPVQRQYPISSFLIANGCQIIGSSQCGQGFCLVQQCCWRAICGRQKGFSALHCCMQQHLSGSQKALWKRRFHQWVRPRKLHVKFGQVKPWRFVFDSLFSIGAGFFIGEGLAKSSSWTSKPSCAVSSSTFCFNFLSVSFILASCLGFQESEYWLYEFKIQISAHSHVDFFTGKESFPKNKSVREKERDGGLFAVFWLLFVFMFVIAYW